MIKRSHRDYEVFILRNKLSRSQVCIMHIICVHHMHKLHRQKQRWNVIFVRPPSRHFKIPIFNLIPHRFWLHLALVVFQKYEYMGLIYRNFVAYLFYFTRSWNWILWKFSGTVLPAKYLNATYSRLQSLLRARSMIIKLWSVKVNQMISSRFQGGKPRNNCYHIYITN